MWFPSKEHAQWLTCAFLVLVCVFMILSFTVFWKRPGIPILATTKKEEQSEVVVHISPKALEPPKHWLLVKHPDLPKTKSQYDIKPRAFILREVLSTYETENMSTHQSEMEEDLDDFEACDMASTSTLAQHIKQAPSLTLLSAEQLQILSRLSESAHIHAQKTGRKDMSVSLISEMVEMIVYVNFDASHKEVVLSYIHDVFKEEDRIELRRLKEASRADLVLCYITALALAHEEQRNVLIVSDETPFFITRAGLEQKLLTVEKEYMDRWQVIGLYTKPSSFLELDACIVNKAYTAFLINKLMEYTYFGTSWHDETHIWLGLQQEVPRAEELVVYVKVRSAAAITQTTTQAELQTILHALYIEAYPGKRLQVMVHHPKNVTFTNKHKRMYSCSFYSGVHYFSDLQQLRNALEGHDSVLWVDLNNLNDAPENLMKTIHNCDLPIRPVIEIKEFDG